MMKTPLLCWAILLLPTLQLAQGLPVAANQIDSEGYRDGPWVIYFDTHFQTVSQPDSATYYREIEYDRGLPTGLSTDYYQSGQVWRRGILIEDYPANTMHGLQSWYHPNGVQAKEMDYWWGRPAGPYREWYPDGQLMVEGQFKAGREVGTWARWAAGGDPIASFNFSGARFRDIAVYFDKLSQLRLEEEPAHLYPLAEEARSFAQVRFGPQHEAYAQALVHLGRLYLDDRKLKEAAPLFEEAFEVYEVHYDTTNPGYAESLLYRGTVDLLSGNKLEGELQVLHAIELQKRQFGTQPFEAERSLGILRPYYSDANPLADSDTVALSSVIQDSSQLIVVEEATEEPVLVDTFFTDQVFYYSEWLSSQGLANYVQFETQPLGKIDQKLQLCLQFLGPEMPASIPMLKNQYQRMAGISLEEALFVQAVHQFELPPDSIMIQVRSLPDSTGGLGMTTNLRYQKSEQDSVRSFQLTAFSDKSEVEIDSVSTAPLILDAAIRTPFQDEIKGIKWPGESTQLRDHLQEQLANYFAEGKGTLVFQRPLGTNGLLLSVKDLQHEVIQPALLKRFLGIELEDPHEQLTLFIKLLPQEDGAVKVITAVNGKFGSGTFQPQSSEYRNMDPTFKFELEDYARNFAGNTLYRWIRSLAAN